MSQPERVPRPVFDLWWANRSDPPLLDFFAGMHRLATHPPFGGGPDDRQP